MHLFSKLTGKSDANDARLQVPFKVNTCQLMDRCMYLPPGNDSRLVLCNNATGLPYETRGSSSGSRKRRVVCISDTHNEHESLRLPDGDILIHSGDCLTETGQRGYVTRNARGVIQEVKEEGIALFNNFAQWFGAQYFANKILVAGNHDLVLQGLGKARVQEILDSHTTNGKCIYLEHEEVCVGGVRIFGSPFAYWGGKNDAFKSRSCDYTDVPEGIHIMVTHMPAILPANRGRFHEDANMLNALHRAGALLHVSGHCHWAHGLYRSSQAVPCVVASVCGGEMFGGVKWSPSYPEKLVSSQGVRGDPLDQEWGGYNLDQLPIVVDIQLPAIEVEDSLQRATSATSSLGSEAPEEDDATGKPAILFFGPPNDPDFVRSMLPRCRKLFDVDFVDETAEGIQRVSERSYVACIAKLGTAGNLSYYIIEALRKKQGTDPFVAIHSATAASNPTMRDQLVAELNVNMFVSSGQEDELFGALERLSHA